MSATLPSVEDMLARLVALPSVSSVSPALDTGNRGVSELLAQWLEDLGLEVTLSDVPGQPSKCNLMATLGEGDGGLALAGHTDTVPFDADRWQSDPFRISRRDDRLYGLGTTDMKGFFAVLLDALAGFPLARLRAPLTVLATADEESGMAGARALARDGRAPARQVLIGEPTALRPVRAHKGIFMLRIVLSGRSGHSSDPALGVSALEGMTAALAALGRLRQELAERWRDERFNVPYPTLNVGRIAGGDNPNRICARCELDMDLRTVPGLGLAAARDLVTTAVTSALSGSGIEVRFESLFDGVEALDTPADAAIVRCCEALSGQQAGCVSFATEAPIYAALGMEAVIMGPGDITVAHQPDEYLALSRIEPMRRAIRQLASDLCL